MYYLGSVLSVRAATTSVTEKNHCSSCQVRRIRFAPKTTIFPCETVGCSSLTVLFLSERWSRSCSSRPIGRQFVRPIAASRPSKCSRVRLNPIPLHRPRQGGHASQAGRPGGPRPTVGRGDQRSLLCPGGPAWLFVARERICVDWPRPLSLLLTLFRCGPGGDPGGRGWCRGAGNRFAPRRWSRRVGGCSRSRWPRGRRGPLAGTPPSAGRCP